MRAHYGVPDPLGLSSRRSQTLMEPVLRRDAHTQEELRRFHADGFVVFPGILTDDATHGFRRE